MEEIRRLKRKKKTKNKEQQKKISHILHEILKVSILNFHVEISIIYECNFKIVKICQKCANFESGSLSEKLLRIEKSSSKSYKLLKSYRAESV